jgi:hypothetical protein
MELASPLKLLKNLPIRRLLIWHFFSKDTIMSGPARCRSFGVGFVGNWEVA